MTRILLILFMPLVTLLASCSKGYKPIDYGSDGCVHCKMTIIDARYGAELVTDKGKVYKFDDILCLKQYMTANSVDEGEIQVYVEKYSEQQNDVIDARQATYVQHEYFASPMNGNYAAFVNTEEAQPFADSLQTDILAWEKIQ